MRHILALFGAEVRGATDYGARSTRERVEAIHARQFLARRQFRPETVAAWLNFYVQALRNPTRRCAAA